MADPVESKRRQVRNLRDAFNAEEPRPNEAGGEFATGVIVKTYEQGKVIDVAVKITANHLGYFLFKLCPNNDVRKEATQECLDEHVLRVSKCGERAKTALTCRHYKS